VLPPMGDLLTESNSVVFIEVFKLLKEMRRLSYESTFAEKWRCVFKSVLFGEVVDVCEKLFP